MGRPRYTIDDEKVSKWLIEDVVDSVLDTDEATRVTVTDEQTGRRGRGVGADHDEALDRACRDLGISPRDLDEELD